MTALDLSELKFRGRMEIEILRPQDSVGTGKKIVLAGPGSPEAVAYERHMFDVRMKELAEYREKVDRALKDGKEAPRVPTETLENRVKQRADFVAAHIVEADSLMYEGSEVNLAKKEDAIKVLSDPGLSWLLNQLAGKLENQVNFLPDVKQI